MSAKINWDQLRLFIFDLDGTLYDQQSLRSFMRKVLLGYYLFRPWRIRELSVIRRFRIEVEKMRDSGNPDPAHQLFVKTASKTAYDPGQVQKLVEKWMYRYPLPYLKRYKYKGVAGLFTLLHQKGKNIAVYSDYPVADKMKALELPADAMLYSLKPEINELKPGTRGLESLMKKFGVRPEQCIFVGDRSDTDGKAAERAGISFLLFREGPQHTDAFNMIKNQLLEQ